MPYSQRDPQWSGHQLGSGPGTIGMWGCYLTSYAQVLTDCGHVVNPADLNGIIPYVDGNELTDHAIDGLAGGDVTTFQVWDFRNTAAHLDMIDDSDPTTRFIIEVDFDHNPNDGIQTHFVTEASWNGTDLFINDPWYGSTDNFALHYGTDIATTIIKVVGLKWHGYQAPVAPVAAPVVVPPAPAPAPPVAPVEAPQAPVAVPVTVVTPPAVPAPPAASKLTRTEKSGLWKLLAAIVRLLLGR